MSLSADEAKALNEHYATNIVDRWEAKKKVAADKFFGAMREMERDNPPYGDLAIFLSENLRINDVDKKEILRLAFKAIKYAQRLPESN